MRTHTTKIILLLIGVGLFITSCQDITTLIPSGNVTIQERDVTNYNGIDVSSALMVDISFSDSEELIEVEADDNIQQYVIVEKVNNVLKVRLQDNINIKSSATLKVHIITKDNMDYYAVSGASHLNVKDTIKTEDVSISISGASTFISPIVGNSLISTVDGASSLSLSGKIDSFQLKAEGASDASGYGLTVEDLDIRLSGASEAKLLVNRTINITASGASSLLYKGNAAINSSNLEGASQIVKVD